MIPENLVKICHGVLELLVKRHFSKWLPDGEIGFTIRLKYNPNLPWIDVNHPSKFGKHIYIIGQTSFFKIAA